MKEVESQRVGDRFERFQVLVVDQIEVAKGGLSDVLLSFGPSDSDPAQC